MFKQLNAKRLLKGKTIGIDVTTLEANAALRRIVCKCTDEDWKGHLGELAKEEGIAKPTDEDRQRFDLVWNDKKVSNIERQSKMDPNRRIAKMKTGSTYLP